MSSTTNFPGSGLDSLMEHMFLRCQITASKTIEKLRFCMPRKVITDNGPTFTSAEFRHFMESSGIKHSTTSPHHPSSGLAEKAVQIIKQALYGRGNVKNMLSIDVPNHTTHYNWKISSRTVNNGSLSKILFRFVLSRG